MINVLAVVLAVAVFLSSGLVDAGWSYCPKLCRDRIEDLEGKIDAIKEKRDWQIVFRADKEVSGNILQKWESKTSFNEDKPAAKQLDCAFTGVYKSAMVEEWDHNIVHQVKVAMYEGSEEKAFAIFNGLGSTKNNFFTKDRLLASSYTDLKETNGNIFSIRGAHGWNRHFYMSKSYGGCGNDHAWMVVADEGNIACPWMEKEHRPYFIYCPHNKECNMETEAKVASTFAVFVKTMPL